MLALAEERGLPVLLLLAPVHLRKLYGAGKFPVDCQSWRMPSEVCFWFAVVCLETVSFFDASRVYHQQFWQVRVRCDNLLDQGFWCITSIAVQAPRTITFLLWIS